MNEYGVYDPTECRARELAEAAGRDFDGDSNRGWLGHRALGGLRRWAMNAEVTNGAPGWRNYEVLTPALRWSDGKLQQMWRVSQLSHGGEFYTEEWRDVPEETA